MPAIGGSVCILCRRYNLYGLYDKEGFLRFTCTDKEACIAYAKLFESSSIEFSLMSLSEINEEAKKEFL